MENQPAMDSITYFKNLPAKPFKTGDEVVSAMDEIQTAKAVLAEAWSSMQQAAIEFITDHGDITIGNARWYVYNEKHYAEVNRETTIAAILNTVNDLGELGEQMGSKPWKHGALKKLLEEQFDSLFTTTYTDRLKLGKDDGHAR